MHILYFHQYFQTVKGNSGTRSYNMAKALIKAGHTVTIVCGSSLNGNTGLNTSFTKGFRRGIVDKIDVIECDLNYSNHLNYKERIKIFFKFTLFSIKIVFKEPADVVFATSTPLSISLPGILARWFKKKIFIFEVRDLWPEIPKAMGVISNKLIIFTANLLENFSYRSANQIIALSPGIAGSINKKGININKITMIPNFSDFNLFTKNTLPVRPEGIGNDDLMAIFVGTHGLANGLDSVLDAALVLKKRGNKDIKFVLIGDGKMKNKLKERAKNQKLDNILFFNSIPKDKLISTLKGADIGMQILANIPAFYYGTSPNKFFDYIAAGLPVLINYPGWLADLIKDNKCGYAIDPNNPEIFADVLINASKNIKELKIMGANSKNLAKKNLILIFCQKSLLIALKNSKM